MKFGKTFERTIKKMCFRKTTFPPPSQFFISLGETDYFWEVGRNIKKSPLPLFDKKTLRFIKMKKINLSSKRKMSKNKKQWRKATWINFLTTISFYLSNILRRGICWKDLDMSCRDKSWIKYIYILTWVAGINIYIYR